MDIIIFNCLKSFGSLIAIRKCFQAALRDVYGRVFRQPNALARRLVVLISNRFGCCERAAVKSGNIPLFFILSVCIAENGIGEAA